MKSRLDGVMDYSRRLIGYDLVKFVLLEGVPDSSVGRASAWEARDPGFESRSGTFFDNTN